MSDDLSDFAPTNIRYYDEDGREISAQEAVALAMRLGVIFQRYDAVRRPAKPEQGSGR